MQMPAPVSEAKQIEALLKCRLKGKGNDLLVMVGPVHVPVY
jgi:hypothetical protein